MGGTEIKTVKGESKTQTCVCACDEYCFVKESLWWRERRIGIFVMVEDERVERHCEMALTVMWSRSACSGTKECSACPCQTWDLLYLYVYLLLSCRCLLVVNRRYGFATGRCNLPRESLRSDKYLQISRGQHAIWFDYLAPYLQLRLKRSFCGCTRCAVVLTSTNPP